MTQEMHNDNEPGTVEVADDTGSSAGLRRDRSGFKKLRAWGLSVFRLIAVIALVALAIVGTVGGPDEEEITQERSIAFAATTAEINESSASGAPQQAVVNGWHAVTLIEAQLEQESAIAMHAGFQRTILMWMLLCVSVLVIVEFVARKRTA